MMASWVYPSAVAAATSGLPGVGRLYWGYIEEPEVGEDGYVTYVPEFENSRTMQDCILFASNLLISTNLNVKQKTPLSSWNSTTANRYLSGRLIRQKLKSDPAADLDFAYWTFDNTTDDALYGASCRVFWSAKGTTSGDQNAVSGVVAAADEGRSTLCLHARYSSDCLTPKTLAQMNKRTDLCTGLSLGNSIGDMCRAWFDALPPLIGAYNKTTIVNAICADRNLDECTCMNREDDPIFVQMKKSSLGSAPVACWWSACKNDDLATRVTPAMEQARSDCKVTNCGNMISFVDSTDNNIMKQINQSVSCVSNSGDSGGSTQVRTDANASVANTPLKASTADEMTATATGSNSTLVIVLLVMLVMLAIIIIIAVAYMRMPSKPAAKDIQ